MSRETPLRNREYLAFLGEIKEWVQKARFQAYRSVNKGVIQLYWDIGKGIVERQDRLGWGKNVVQKLSADLRKDVPGKAGFSAQNLWYMRKFYLAYRDKPNLQQLAGEIPWFTNMAILDKVSDVVAREYYLRAVRDMGWSRPVLIHKIEAGTYERHRSADKQHNFPKALPKHLVLLRISSFFTSMAPSDDMTT